MYATREIYEIIEIMVNGSDRAVLAARERTISLLISLYCQDIKFI
jgi:hypothetical protein